MPGEREELLGCNVMGHDQADGGYSQGRAVEHAVRSAEGGGRLQNYKLYYDQLNKKSE